MRSRLAVLMFADVVGYTAMMEADQGETIDAIRALRVNVLEPLAHQHQGRVLKNLGDGWILSFESAAGCVRAAVAIQEEVQRDWALKLRLGAHVGELVADEQDFYGSGLNLAQRIEAEAPPGGFMVSEDLFRQLPIAQTADLKDAGTFRLKNIALPVRLFQWRPSEQGMRGNSDITSIAIAAIEHAPQSDEAADLSADLRDQLMIRMSRRQGIMVLDATKTPTAEATYELRSRLRMASGKARLSLTLVLRSEARPVWSENYEHLTEDIFEFCDAVLERAEGDLRLQTNAFDGDRLSHIPDNELSVSELRTRAANCFYRVTYDEWLHALELMNRAIEMNPQDAVALAMRGEAHVMLVAARYETLEPDVVASIGQDLDLAVEQNPLSDYVFWMRGFFRIQCCGDSSGARADLARSRTLNAAYLENHELEGHILMAAGEFRAAADSFGRSLQRQSHDPLMPYRLFLRAAAHYAAGDTPKAISDAQAAANLRPSERGLHVMVGLAHKAAGDSVAANDSFDRAAALPPLPGIASRCPVMPEAFGEFVSQLASAVRSPQGRLDGIR